MARTRLRKCRFCSISFLPHPRLGRRQSACPAPECQAKRKAANRAKWDRAHPEYHLGQYPKKRAWFQARPGYHAARRQANPELAQRHRERERERRRSLQDPMALQDAMRIQDAVAKDLGADADRVAQPDSIIIQLSLAQQLAGDRPRVAQPDSIAHDILQRYKRLRGLHHLACRLRRRRHG